MTAPVAQCQPMDTELRQHSPLPWRVFTNPDGTKLVGIGGQDGEGILDCGFGVWSWNDPEGIANANLVVEAVNNYTRLTERCEQYKGQVKAGSDEIDALKARVLELESRLQVGAETFGEACKRIDVLKDALRSISTQCGNVIFNCEQRPADNDRHLASWKGVKEFTEAALSPDGNSGEGM